MCNPEELMAYLDGEAPVTVGEHVRGCADCQALAAEWRDVSARMLEWTVEPPSADLDRRVRAALGTEKKGLARRWWPWALGTVGVCLVLVVAVGVRPHPHEAAPTMSAYLNAPADKAASPMIARTAQINFTTTEFDRSRAALEQILGRHEGYFGNITVANRTLEATLRVPARASRCRAR